MDDFEFKPLTEGLGFHKKIIDLKEEQSHLSQGNLSDMSFMSSTGVLPKPRTQAGAVSTPPAPVAKVAMPNGATPASQKNPGSISPSAVHPSSTNASARPLSRGPHAPAPWAPSLSGKAFKENVALTKGAQWVVVPASWPASIFDSTMILGMTLLFSAVVFAITGISLSDLTDMLRNDPAAQLASAVLLICVLEIYAVGCRTFFNMTLGEWAFDYRLGTVEDRQSTVYPIMVAWRALLITLTGFVVLPAISSIVKRDVTGLLTGVDLYAEKR